VLLASRYKTGGLISPIRGIPCITIRAIMKTDSPQGLEGHGLAFTKGRGSEICVCAAHAYKHLVVGRRLDSITSDFALFWRELACETQLRKRHPSHGNGCYCQCPLGPLRKIRKQHFVNPVVIRNARYMPPLESGYSTTIKPGSRVMHAFPDGTASRRKTAG
jgi:hypothetical protein